MSIASVRRRARGGTRGRRTAAAPTRRQLRELEADLRSELRRLERSLAAGASAEGSPAGLAPPDAGRVRAPADAEEGVAIALGSRAQLRHAAIVGALARLEEGRYGRCASCGERIPFGRLQVMPETPYCMACGAGA